MEKTAFFNIGDIVEPKMDEFEGLLLVLSKEPFYNKAIYITGDNDTIRRNIYSTEYYSKVGNIFSKGVKNEIHRL